MQSQVEHLMRVDGELRVPTATARLVRFDIVGPADNIMSERDTYWLDHCLTPRAPNARACYRERWSPHRFERIGRVALLPPHETIHTRSDGNSTQASILCLLRPEAMSQWFGRDLQWSDRQLAGSLDIPDANVRSLLLRLAQEIRQPGFASDVMAELITAQLVIELGRYCTSIGENRASGGLAPWRLRLIDERLREAGETPTLTELAELCKLSVRQLTRGFRASRGISIGEHFANSRIDHAKRMLDAGDSVKAIAYSLGFSSPSSFCFAFRRATGETPREFKHRGLRTAH